MVNARVRAVAACAVLLACAGGRVLAQEADPPPPPALLGAAAGDSVRLLLTIEPPLFGGFHVYRTAPGGQAQRLTDEPVRRIADPRLAAALLGSDLPLLMRALEADDETDLLRSLQRDAFAAHVFGLLMPHVARVLGRHYVDRDVVQGATYEYRVAFTDARGAETGESHSAGVPVIEAAPAQPASLQAQAEDAQVLLSWPYAAYLGEPGDITIGFHVYREQEGAPTERLTGTPLLRDQRPTAEFRDTAAVNGRTYTYFIRAIDLAGREGPPSPSASAAPEDLTPPAPPAGLQVTPGDGRVQLEWLYATEADADGYHVFRSTGLDQPFGRLTDVPVPPRSPFFGDSTVTGGTQYFYRITTVDTRGNESRPGNAISALPYDHTAPEPPAALGVEVAGRRLMLRWNASPSPDVKGYYIYRGGGAERLVRLVEQPLAATEFTDSGYAAAGLAPGRTYDVQVTAVDRSYNESAPVAATAVVPDDAPPTPPTGFAARSHRGRWVELSWSSSAALDVAEYVVTRTNEAGAEPVVVARTDSPAEWAVRDSALQQGIRYTYALTAVDSAGNRSDPATSSVVFRGVTPPPAPRFVAARLAEGGVVTWWERVVSADLAGYRLYRSRLPTGVPERVADVASDALTVTDPNGSADWFYTVRAVDRSGNESAASPAARPVR
ncbi:MAG: hypothetical protein WEF86_02000 [Gemmatimonadota bacterium]